MADGQVEKNFVKFWLIFLKILIITSLFIVEKLHADVETTPSQNGTVTDTGSFIYSAENPWNLGPNLPLLLDFADLRKIRGERKGAVLAPDDRILPWCEAYMHAFAKAASYFIACTIHHARPLTFCENCVQQYKILVNLVKEIDIQDEKHKAGISGSCLKSLLSADKVNVVGVTHEFVKKIWSDSACDRCFDHYELVNGTIEYLFANGTLEFEKKYNSTHQCMLQFIAKPVDPDSPMEDFNQTACDVCGDLYDDLNDYYYELEKKGVVCMDIVDTMNYTRNQWSKKFKCTLQQKDLPAVLTITGIFCLLPIVFYSAAKFHGSRKQIKIVKQRRMTSTASLGQLAPSDSSNNTPSVLSPTEEETSDEDVTMRQRDKEGENGEKPTASGHQPKVVFQI